MAVTQSKRNLRGSNRFKPYPDYRHLGAEWLDCVPVGWEVKRLKYLASINDEVLPEDTDPDYELLYVDISSVDTIRGIVAKEPYRFAQAPSRARRRVQNGDVIVSTVRTYLRAITRIEAAEPNLIVSTGFAVIRPTRELIPRFAAYALRAPYFVERVVAHSVGVSYPAINASELATFSIAVPTEGEQLAISKFLDRAMSKINSVNQTAQIEAFTGRIHDVVVRLEEYRTALISAAVTGKIDVREEVP